MKTAAIVVLLAGCFSKPGAPGVPVDAPPDVPGGCTPTQPSAPGMTLNAARDAITIQPGMTFSFADESMTVPMPERITLNDVNFLATREVCTIEDQAGIAMYPSFQISPGTGVSATPVRSLVRRVTGPAYSEFRVRWQRDLMCSVATTAEGETSFSMFPDGRIVRTDTVVPSNSSTPVTAANCVCMGGGTDFLITSFYAFERDVLAAFARINQGFQPFPTNQITGESGGCVTLEAGGAVALFWDLFTGESPTMPPTRIRSATNLAAEPDHRVFAFVYDLHTGPIQEGLSVGVRTTMMLDADASTCTTVSNRAVAKAVQPPITVAAVGGANSLVTANGFGLYDDVTPHLEPVTISVGPAGSVPAGFAVTMSLPGTAISTNRPADDVIWQRESDGRFYIWFREGLSGTDTITITPEC